MILKAGDEMKCWRCPSWHVLERGLQTGHAYADKMLYITCHGGRYYAGGEGGKPDQPVRPGQSAAASETSDRSR